MLLFFQFLVPELKSCQSFEKHLVLLYIYPILIFSVSQTSYMQQLFHLDGQCSINVPLKLCHYAMIFFSFFAGKASLYSDSESCQRFHNIAKFFDMQMLQIPLIVKAKLAAVSNICLDDLKTYQLSILTTDIINYNKKSYRTYISFI